MEQAFCGKQCKGGTTKGDEKNGLTKGYQGHASSMRTYRNRMC